MFERWFNDIYRRGYEAGYNTRVVEDHEDQNRRLDDMLQYGKSIGRNDGYIEGYKAGWSKGEEEGYIKAKTEVEEIDLDDLDFDEELDDEVFEEDSDDSDNEHGEET